MFYQKSGKSMDSQNQRTEQLPENDKSIYVPNDLYHSFHNIFEKMKKAQRELHEVKDDMKPIE